MMNYNYKRGSKFTLGSCLVFLLLILVILAIGYGMSVLLVGAGMWALCKLGVIAAWTWKQAALWALVIEIALGFLRTIVRNVKGND